MKTAGLICVAGFLLLSGCSEDPRIEKAQALVVSKAPNGIRSVKSTKKALADVGYVDPESAEEADNEDVVLVGRIYAGPDASPWDSQRAAFILACSKDGNDSDHDPYSCPFCRKKIDEHIAFVEFEMDGQVVDIPAQKLFGLTEKQKVVLRGKGSVNSRGELIVKASKLFKAPADWEMPESDEPARNHDSDDAATSEVTEPDSPATDADASTPADTDDAPASDSAEPPAESAAK